MGSRQLETKLIEEAEGLASDITHIATKLTVDELGYMINLMKTSRALLAHAPSRVDDELA